ncbi:MAG TPA: ABC transporter permease [Methylomirabilota bacterium]|nr:ABC transporter permease [Methylomirabilota bacterium]
MEAVASAARPSLLRARARAFWASPASRVGLVVALAILTMALWPRAWLAHDPTLIDLGAAKRPGFWVGDWAHPLGTDFLGRDLVARSIFATRLTLVISGSAVLLAATIGIGLGLAAGFYRGWVDEVVSWLVDVQLAFPVIALAVAIVAIVKGGLVTLIVVLAVTSWSTMARVVRAQALSARTEPYVEAARALGSPTGSILARHILPNVLSPLLAVATYEVSRLVLTESALSFLGLGVTPPAVTWGGMIGDGRNFIYDAWWTATVPGVMIAIMVLAFNFVGDGLRDAFDPTSWPTRARRGRPGRRDPERSSS